MPNSVTKLPLAPLAVAGTTGGLVAGSAMFAFTLLGNHAMFPAFFQQITHIAMQQQDFPAGIATLIGVGIHFAVSVGWAIGFATMAYRTPALRRSPVLSGICCGIIVELMMDGLLVMVNALTSPSPLQFLRDVLAHTLAFGVPLAYTVAALLPPAPLTASMSANAQPQPQPQQ